MNVRDVMDSNPSTVGPDATVADVGRLMLEENLDGVPVVATSGQLLGMVTRTDLVAKHARVHFPLYFAILGTVMPIERRHSDEDMRRTLAVTARDLMEEDVPVISPDATVDDAATLLIEHHVNALPVMENDRLVGMIDQADIIRLLLIEEGDADQPPSP